MEGNPGKYPIEESGIEALGHPFVAEHLMEDARGCIAVCRPLVGFLSAFKEGVLASTG